MEKNKLVAVYGSLLSELGNHSVISNGELLGEEIVEIPFKMLNLGGFPGLIADDENHKVKIEVYSCDKDTYKRVERLESYPSFYDRVPVETEHGEAEIYFLRSDNWGSDAVVKKDDIFDWRHHMTNVRKNWVY